MIRDTRIGKKAPNGRVLNKPSFYVNGAVYNKITNPAPSTFALSNEYFVYLPIHYIPSLEEVNELKEIAGIVVEESEAVEDTKDVTEDSGSDYLQVKGGRKILVLGNVAVNLEKDS